MCILCILFIVVSLYIFFTGLKYSDQVSFAFTMYRFFSVLWALKMSRFIFSFALAFLVLYVFLCLAGVFAIFVHAFHVCPFSFFPLGLRDVFQDVCSLVFAYFVAFHRLNKTTTTTTTTTALLFQRNIFAQRTHKRMQMLSIDPLPQPLSGGKRMQKVFERDTTLQDT